MLKKRILFWSLIFMFCVIIFGYDMTSRTPQKADAQDCVNITLWSGSTPNNATCHSCVAAEPAGAYGANWFICLCFS